MNVIEIEGLKKQLGNFTLDIPNLVIKEGYITGFIGQNGAGKTTTLRLIMGLLTPDKGEIKVFGQSSSQEGEAIRNQIGYVGEPTGYFSEATVEQTRKMIAPFYTSWDNDLFNKYINLFALDRSKKIKELSQGQGKQFALIMALAHRPKLILLDEPTANLDPVVRHQILDLLMEHMQHEEVSTFYSTHITSDLDKASDYIIMLQKGKVVMYEDKEQIDDKYYIVKGSKGLLEKGIQNELIGIDQNKFGFQALTTKKQMLENKFGKDLIFEKATLEDMMVYIERGNRS
ncbi:ABC transporter ATP-binding protein [Niameybacter massiliensis]|uniref:ABC transporter ATP-binding protein n=1 Tax=Niameybacter massiliensis TaxID=1658108 RepID=UPI0006B4809C|nr:ABC transporter ATP-binding protein [Niameybacter massiliensis]